MKNIEAAIFPLLFMLCICGLYIIEFPKGRPRLHFTLLYMLVLNFLHIYFVAIVKVFLFETWATDFQTFIYFVTLMVPVLMGLSIFYYKKFKCCLKKLDIVNGTFEELGTSKNYTRLHARTIWIIIGWIVSMFLMDSFDSLLVSTYTSSFYYICLPYMLHYSTHITALHGLTFMMLLRYIGSLYEQINEYVEKLIEQKQQRVRLAWTTSTSSSFMQRHLTNNIKSNQLLCILMHVHLELFSISRELNTIFGLQMMVQVAMFHLSGVHFILQFYRDITSIKINTIYVSTIHIFCMFIWALRYTINVIVFIYICEEVCAKANRTAEYLNRLANITFDVEMQENIKQFLLEILRRPLKITAFGFYDYSSKLILMFAERIMKIAVIVLQEY